MGPSEMFGLVYSGLFYNQKVKTIFLSSEPNERIS